MRTIDTKEIENAVYRLAIKACTGITEPCKKALIKAREVETSPACAFALDTVLKNGEIANSLQMPVCQDTGLACVLLEIGQNVSLIGAPLSDAVNNGVRRAYKDGSFRFSVCDPLTRVNTGDNTPAVIHTEIVNGDRVNITFLPKGFGSENMSRIFMLTPKNGVNGVIDAVVETVRLAGSKPCPPVMVGVGIGGSFDLAAFLSKKALAREVGTHNQREDVAEIERVALDRINNLKIGAQGFGGEVTAVGVNCEIAPTHIAGLPVAVNIQCHCVRVEKESL
ncbi:MAG: fumarate hydratase [Clostridia bacterium]|nr:fumarate hydratase [Clostridia bacterium]